MEATSKLASIYCDFTALLHPGFAAFPAESLWLSVAEKIVEAMPQAAQPQNSGNWSERQSLSARNAAKPRKSAIHDLKFANFSRSSTQFGPELRVG
ncbi:MAG TPA: hypothetical protein VIK24_00145 [Pyrinomonadaceae bacterium]